MAKIEQFPLNELNLSPLNVRNTRKADDVTKMAASLLAHGQLQNLGGYREKGQIFISAGGTRLLGYQELLAAGSIKPTHPVDVRIMSKAKAAEASLVENIQRQNMHPAEQLTAFEALLGTKSVESIAADFGFAVKHVRGILKLTTVSPALREKFAQDEISMETMRALALFETHQAQEDVFRQCGDMHSWIRRIWKSRGVVAESRKAAFVGEAAYVAAGGNIEKDIFSDDVIFKDPELLERLFEEKLNETGENLRAEGWAWVEFEADSYPRYGNRAEPDLVWDSEASHEEADRLDERLHALYREVEALEEAGDSEERGDELEDKVEALLSDIENHKEQHLIESYTDEQKASSGATYRFNPHWGLQVERGIIRPQAAQGSDEQSDEPGQDHHQAPVEPAPKTMPETVRETLTDLHTLAVQERVAQDSKAAMVIFICKHFDALGVSDNGDAMMGYQRAARLNSHIRIEPFTGAEKEHVCDSGVYERMEARLDEVVKDAPALEDGDDIMPWLMSLDMEQLLPMFSYIMARSLHACSWNNRKSNSPMVPLQEMLGYDTSDAIELTYDNFYSRLKRPQLMTLLADNGVTEGINPKLKVKELARFTADTLAEKGFKHPFFQ